MLLTVSSVLTADQLNDIAALAPSLSWADGRRTAGATALLGSRQQQVREAVRSCSAAHHRVCTDGFEETHAYDGAGPTRQVGLLVVLHGPCGGTGSAATVGPRQRGREGCNVVQLVGRQHGRDCEQH